MKRQGLAYAALSIGSLVIFAIAARGALLAQGRHAAQTIAVGSTVAAIMGTLAVLYGLLALVFLRRAVTVAAGAESRLVFQHRHGQFVVARNAVKVLKRIGGPNAAEPSPTAYAVVRAQGKVWVCNATELPSEASRSEA